MIQRGRAAPRGRLIMGLMSGTSHDGTDAALLRITERPRRYELLHHAHLNHPLALRKRIAETFTGSVRDVCELNAALGEQFARAALKCAQEAGIDITRLDAIASHGQTVYHIPPTGRSPGSTLQVGEPSIIARRTGVPVVSNFREADMAEGGHGAPLVPLADWLLFRRRAPIAVHNLGGISNLTVVTRKKDEVIAFDTGPGCALIDDAAKLLFDKPYDRNGSIARGGSPDQFLLDVLMRDPFFKRKPPKSTGRERYSHELMKDLWAKKSLLPEDFLSTLTHLTAQSIAKAYQRYVLPKIPIKEIVLAGGGARNQYLFELISGALAPVPVRLVDELGIPSEAKEAMSFAVLAHETLAGRPGNLPRATGARRAVVLGSLTRP